MKVEKSFITLYKNDFDSAKRNENPNFSTLNYEGFIQQLPTEMFTQTTNLNEGIAFAGGISVDLINGCGALVQNIDNNFYYESFIDDEGFPQISFEFGFIGVNYYTKSLYLRITDSGNGNIYYSNSFLITDYYANLSTRFDFKNANDLYYKSVRIANTFYRNPTNKLDLKIYTTTQGFQTSYREIPTYLQRFVIDRMDFFVNDRLTDLFTHSIIYVNGQMVTSSDFKTEFVEGESNLLKGEFTINPLNEIRQFQTQIYESLDIVSMFPIIGSTITADNIWILGSSSQNVVINYNKNASLTNGSQAKLYRNGLLIETITKGSSYELNNNVLFLEFAYFNGLLEDILNGDYEIRITNTDITSGVEIAPVITWTFTIADGEYSNTDYDNSQYLTN